MINLSGELILLREKVDRTDAVLVIEIDQEIRADRSRLQQLLENLFGNVVEHGVESVTITVGGLEDESGFFVADNGAGIPTNKRRNVFELGYSSSETSTGFGLSIVKQIAKAHNWEIDLVDSADGGARFEITGVELVVD